MSTHKRTKVPSLKKDKEEAAVGVFSTTPTLRKPTPVKNAVVVFLECIVVIAVILCYCDYVQDILPEPKPATVPDEYFSEERALRHLHRLEKIGAKLAGTVNEREAAEYIVSTLRQYEISTSTLKKANRLELDVQSASGSLIHFNFLESTLVTKYDNLTNIVVRVSSQSSDMSRALLVNSHFDSAVMGPGASDASAGVSVMLEMIRCLTLGSNVPLLNPIIFLFNGAEEYFVQASHGFISSHPWASTAAAVLNLDSAGSGGKAVVFQAGPKNAWITRVFGSVAPYAHGNVIGQDIFGSGLIPSDTDFRVFRDYGNIPGIDVAFYDNGYYYHTKLDKSKYITPGSIQHVGDNCLEFVKEMGNGKVTGPQRNEERLAESVYFNINLMQDWWIVYTYGTAVLLHSGALVAAFFIIKSRGSTISSAHTHGGIVRFGARGCGWMFASLLAGVLSAVGLAVAMIFLNIKMAWFDHPYFGLVMYGTPALLGMTLVQSFVPGDPFVAYKQMLHGSCYLWSSFLILGTYYRIGSSYLFFFFLVSSLLALAIEDQEGLAAWTVTVIAPTITFSSISLMISRLFVPLLGRGGPDQAGEVVFGVLMSLICCFHLIPALPRYHLSDPATRRTLRKCLLGVSAVIVFVIAFRVPFNERCPRRILLQHQTTYQPAKDGNEVTRKNSLMAFQTDMQDKNTLLEVSSNAAGVPFTHVSGSGRPSLSGFYPIENIFNEVMVASEVPNPSYEMPMLEVETTMDDVNKLKIIKITVKSPDTQYTTLRFADVSPTQRLVGWSLPHPITPVRQMPFRGTENSINDYLIRHIGGVDDLGKSWSVTLKYKNLKEFETLRVELASLHFPTASSYVMDVTNQFPNWVAPVGWEGSTSIWNI